MDETAVVYRVPDCAPARSPPHYHADRDCHALKRAIGAVETTVRKARAQGREPCSDCVGRRCPRCGDLIPRLRYHLQTCPGSTPETDD